MMSFIFSTAYGMQAPRDGLETIFPEKPGRPDPIDRLIRTRPLRDVLQEEAARRGRALELSGQFQEALAAEDERHAEAICREFWRLSPGDPFVYQSLSRLALLRGRRGEAVARLNQALHYLRKRTAKAQSAPETSVEASQQRAMYQIGSALLYLDKAQIYLGQWRIRRAAREIAQSVTHFRKGLELGGFVEESVLPYYEKALALQSRIVFSEPPEIF